MDTEGNPLPGVTVLLKGMNEGFFCERDLFLHSGKFLFGLGAVSYTHLKPVSETLPGKLPQRKLVTTAAAGYSSYGNQIGLATGQVDEI